MSEFSERLKDRWSRFNLRDGGTQLTLAGSVAVIVLLVAVIAWSAGGPSGDAGRAPGAIAERAAELAEQPDEVVGGESVAVDGPLSARAKSSARVRPADVSGSAPADLPPITETTVKVGITYTEDPGGANAAAGFTVGQVDQRRGWEALIAQINKAPAF